jgi:acyl carrier protein
VLEYPPEALPALLPTTSIFEELEFDSFQALEMILVIESLAGIEYPPIDVPPIFCLADAFAYYQLCVEAAIAE